MSPRRRIVRDRYPLVLRLTALLWACAAVVLVLPLPSILFHPDEWRLWWAFGLPAVALMLSSIVILFRTPEVKRFPTTAEAALVVTLGWSGAILAAAMVFVLSAGMGPLNALFEATSGWTTTGLSVLDVERAPRVVLLLRSLLEYAGGVGIAIVMISVLGGPPASGLAVTEGRSDPLAAHVARSSKLVIGLTTGYAILGTIAYVIAGMSWFDAINHALAAVSTGGFSTRAASIGAWDSVAVEGVSIVLMLLGTTNLVVAWAALRGKPGVLLRHGEIRLMAVLLGGAAILLALSVPTYQTVGRQVRASVFHAVSASSTTGFATAEFGAWGSVPLLVLAGLMLIGGGAGSTAGGLKLARLQTLLAATIWQVRRGLLPARAINRPRVLQVGRRRELTADDIATVGGFATAWLALFAGGAFVITLHGYPLDASLFEMASALGTVGLSIGITAADAPPVVLAVEMVGMLLGRLEVFVVLIALFRAATDVWTTGADRIPASRDRREAARAKKEEPRRG